MAPNRELTVIVCVTSGSLGIGKNGKLPWPKIKKDFSNFCKVTTSTTDPSKENAVLMGMTTYVSLPENKRYGVGNISQHVELFYLKILYCCAFVMDGWI